MPNHRQRHRIAWKPVIQIKFVKVLDTGAEGYSAAFEVWRCQWFDGGLTDAMRPWLERQLHRLPARSGLAEAIRYALARWDALCRFIDDGRIELDTNTVERAIRPITMAESFCTPFVSAWKH